MIVHRFARVAAFAVLFATAAGCGARDGGACQLDADCAAGLFCCKNTRAPEARGVCRAIGTTVCATSTADAFVPDASTSEIDAFSEDTGAAEDTGVGDDTGTADDAGIDANAVDSGPVPEDANVDAGS